MQTKTKFLIIVVLLVCVFSYAQAKPRVTLAPSGGFLVDGKPFLPIWAWNQPSNLIYTHKKLGMNTLNAGHPESADPALKYLDKLYREKMMMVVDAKLCSKVKGHPAVLMYMVGHEDDIAVRAYAVEFEKSSKSIWIEAEEPVESTFPKSTWLDMGEPLSVMSNGRWLTAAEKGDWSAGYEFKAAKSGTYNLWAREFTKDWANPTTWRVDDGKWQTTPRSLRSSNVEEFSNGRGVGWCKYGNVKLSAGDHKLQIKVAKGRTCGTGKPIDGVISGYDGFAFTDSELQPKGSKGVSLPVRHPRRQKALYDQVKACDPDAQTFVIFSAGFFGRYRKIDQDWYRQFNQYADVTGFDHYPVTGWNQPKWVPEVGLATKKLAELARPSQPVITFIESSDQELSWTAEGFRPPSPEEMRCEAFGAIANGAKGIGHFTIAFGRGKGFKWVNLTDAMQAELKHTNGQMTRLTAPIVIGKDISDKVTVTGDKTSDKIAQGRAIQYIAKHHDNATYIIAVNVTRKAVAPVFTLTLTASKAEVFEEARTVTVEGSKFSDKFEPLEVHVYILKD